MTHLKMALISLAALVAVLLFVQCIPGGPEPDADIPVWRMPPGTRSVVVCEGERLEIQPLTPTQVRLLCVAANSPLPTPAAEQE